MPSSPGGIKFYKARSVLSWPAWLRVAATAPVLAVLWLAVWWASAEVPPL